MTAEVYWHTRRRLYSVRDPRTRLVTDHAARLLLSDASLLVSPAGRARVLREGRKNVHATIRGTILSEEPPPTVWREVTYDPYRFLAFTDRETGDPIYAAALVRCEVEAGHPRVYIA